MCPLEREQARRETQQWVMRRLPTADSIVEMGEKVGHELMLSMVATARIVAAGTNRSIVFARWRPYVPHQYMVEWFLVSPESVHPFCRAHQRVPTRRQRETRRDTDHATSAQE